MHGAHHVAQKSMKINGLIKSFDSGGLTHSVILIGVLSCATKGLL